MHELAPDSFAQASHLLHGFAHFLVVPTLLQRLVPARMWMLEDTDRSACLCWDMLDSILFLVGNPADPQLHQDLRRLFGNTILPAARQRDLSTLHLQFQPANWQEQLPGVLPDLDLRPKAIYFYTQPAPSFQELRPTQPTAPAGFELHAITSDLLTSASWTNLAVVAATIKACWRTLENYQAHGRGYCLVHGQTVAAWCSTDFVFDGQCELYVETFPPYQRQGCGTLVAQACVTECLRQGLSIHWHCWEDHHGSIRIAEHAGLTKAAECPGYWIQVRPEASRSEEFPQAGD
jgi:RimJ/RimL family protein N-acetyltransferase